MRIRQSIGPVHPRLPSKKKEKKQKQKHNNNNRYVYTVNMYDKYPLSRVFVWLLLLFLCTLTLHDIYSKTGDGGNAGRQAINVREVRGKVELTSCRGMGGQAAANGAGGRGWYPNRWLRYRPF